MDKKTDTASRRSRFLKARPKAVEIPPEPLVRWRVLDSTRDFPAVAEPRSSGEAGDADFDPFGWAAAHRDEVDARLRRHGALLLRGFPLPDVASFRRLAEILGPELVDYNEPSTPRTELGDKVYTSTEYPPDQVIPLHNELSYGHSWPRRLYFYCVTAAPVGGETPIADSREVLRRLDPAVRRRFLERGVAYVRNFGDGVGMPWQKVFNAGSREEVERFARDHDIELEWRSEGRLRSRHWRPAAVRHPDTGEAVWFNQANVHHPASLPAALRASLLAVAEDREYPLDMNARYGDGSPIPDADLEAVRRAYEEATVTFPWQEGDVVIVDNMRMAHGRSTYEGPRKIVVLMAEPSSEAEPVTAAQEVGVGEPR